jgi:hypothetical protein
LLVWPAIGCTGIRGGERISSIQQYDAHCGAGKALIVSGLIRLGPELQEFVFLESLRAWSPYEPGPGAFESRLSSEMKASERKAVDRKIKKSPNVGRWWAIWRVRMLVQDLGCDAKRLDTIHFLQLEILSPEGYAALYASMQGDRP